MVITHFRAKRKSTGGRYIQAQKKRTYESGSEPTLTKIGKKKAKTTRTKGGSKKLKLLHADIINLYDPKSKKHAKITVKSVAENPANRHFVRRNILTKGAVIETEKGKARVTSRPGQEGTVNAVLVE